MAPRATTPMLNNVKSLQVLSPIGAQKQSSSNLMDMLLYDKRAIIRLVTVLVRDLKCLVMKPKNNLSMKRNELAFHLGQVQPTNRDGP